jgi:hypothetical protein
VANGVHISNLFNNLMALTISQAIQCDSNVIMKNQLANLSLYEGKNILKKACYISVTLQSTRVYSHTA